VKPVTDKYGDQHSELCPLEIQIPRLMIDARAGVCDLVERLKFYQAADHLLIQEVGIMPLTYNRWQLFIKPWVKRYPISAFNAAYWKDVIIEPH
jgi:hypothetical protein